MKKEKCTSLILIVSLLMAGCSGQGATSKDNTMPEVENENGSEAVVAEDNDMENNDMEEDKPADAVRESPCYYHSASDADESAVYLGGAGGIYKVDVASGGGYQRFIPRPI